MSRCAILTCSINCHTVCRKPSTNAPRFASGKPSIASMKCTCAPPPFKRETRCSRNARSGFPALLFFFVVRLFFFFTRVSYFSLEKQLPRRSGTEYCVVFTKPAFSHIFSYCQKVQASSESVPASMKPAILTFRYHKLYTRSLSKRFSLRANRLPESRSAGILSFPRNSQEAIDET